MIDIVNLAFGVTFTIFLISSAASIRRRNIILFQTGVVISVLIPYTLLEAWGSSVLTLGVLLRQIFALIGLKYSIFNTLPAMIFIILAQVGAFFMVVDIQEVSAVAFIPLAAAIINTVSLFMTDVVKLKIGYIIGGFLWLTNEYIHGLYGQMVGEGINLLLMMFVVFWVTAYRKIGVAESDIPTFKIVNYRDAPFLQNHTRFRKKAIST